MVEAQRSEKRRHPILMAVVALALALALAGTALAARSVVKAKKTDKWGPVHTYIAEGDRVVWKNPTNKVHDVHSIGNWSLSAKLRPGEKVGRRFRDLGTFRYRCVRHSAIVDGGRCKGMCGFVHVVTQ